MEDDILGLQELLDLAGGLTEFTIEERQQANQAGADVLEDALTKATKEKHYSKRKADSKDKHLADSITTGTLEGSAPDGDVAVGFSVKDAGKAKTARLLNDGSKKMAGDSFWDETLANNEDKALDAQIKVIQDILDKKEG